MRIINRFAIAVVIACFSLFFFGEFAHYGFDSRSIATEAAVAAGEPATVNVAHFAPFADTIDGTSVTVRVNGADALTDFKFGDIQPGIELPAGAYLIEILPTGTDTVAISGTVVLEENMQYTLAAIGDGSNQELALLPFVDETHPADSGAKVRIAHLSPFAADLDATKVDICTDTNVVVLPGVPYGVYTDPYLNLPAGDYDLKIALADTDCGTVALDLPSVRLSDGDIVDLFAIGLPGGPIDFTVASITGFTLTPAEPATVNVAHFAPFADTIDGTSVTVRVNGADALTDFKFGDIQPGIELPAGEYLIEILPTGTDTVAISGTVTVAEGVQYTLAAIGDGTNQPLELLPLIDDTHPAETGAKVRIAHLSPFAADLDATKVDICTDSNMVVLPGVPYGVYTDPYLNLPAGDYDLKIALADTNCEAVALDLPSVRLSDGDIVDLFAIGLPGGPIDFTVTSITGFTLTPDENLIHNPSFEAGEERWRFYTDAAGTFATGAPSTDGDAAATVTIDAAGHNVQLYQKGLELESDTYYQLQFDAMANNGQDMRVYVHKHGAPYTNYGLRTAQVDLTSEYQTYTWTFKTKRFDGTVDDGRLRFWFAPFAQAGDSYMIDNVVLTKVDGMAAAALAQASSLPQGNVSVIDDEAGVTAGGPVVEEETSSSATQIFLPIIQQ